MQLNHKCQITNFDIYYLNNIFLISAYEFSASIGNLKKKSFVGLLLQDCVLSSFIHFT